MSSVTVQIVETSLEGSCPVLYEVRHVRGGRGWTVQRRYSALHAMKEALRAKKAKLPSLPFPPKRCNSVLAPCSRGMLRRRQEDLQLYLCALSKLQDSWDSPVVKQVLCSVEERTADQAGEQASSVPNQARTTEGALSKPAKSVPEGVEKVPGSTPPFTSPEDHSESPVLVSGDVMPHAMPSHSEVEPTGPIGPPLETIGDEASLVLETLIANKTVAVGAVMAQIEKVDAPTAKKVEDRPVKETESPAVEETEPSMAEGTEGQSAEETEHLMTEETGELPAEEIEAPTREEVAAPTVEETDNTPAEETEASSVEEAALQATEARILPAEEIKTETENVEASSAIEAEDLPAEKTEEVKASPLVEAKAPPVEEAYVPPTDGAEAAPVEETEEADVPPTVDAEAPPAEEADVPPTVDAEAPPAEEAEAPPAEELPAEEADVPPTVDAEATPAEEAEAPPAEELPAEEADVPPTVDAEAPPAEETDVPPTVDAEAPPAEEAEAPPAEELPAEEADVPPTVDAEAPPAEEAEAPPAEELPAEEADVPPTVDAEAPPAEEADVPSTVDAEAPPEEEMEEVVAQPSDEAEILPAEEVDPSPAVEAEASPAEETDVPPVVEAEASLEEHAETETERTQEEAAGVTHRPQEISSVDGGVIPAVPAMEVHPATLEVPVEPMIVTLPSVDVDEGCPPVLPTPAVRGAENTWDTKAVMKLGAAPEEEEVEDDGGVSAPAADIRLELPAAVRHLPTTGGSEEASVKGDAPGEAVGEAQIQSATAENDSTGEQTFGATSSLKSQLPEDGDAKDSPGQGETEQAAPAKQKSLLRRAAQTLKITSGKPGTVPLSDLDSPSGGSSVNPRRSSSGRLSTLRTKARNFTKRLSGGGGSGPLSAPPPKSKGRSFFSMAFNAEENGAAEVTDEVADKNGAGSPSTSAVLLVETVAQGGDQIIAVGAQDGVGADSSLPSPGGETEASKMF